MECAPLAVTNKDQKPKHDDIKVHDVLVLEISWFVVVVDGCTIVDINSYIECFLVAKKQQQTNFFDINDDQRLG